MQKSMWRIIISAVIFIAALSTHTYNQWAGTILYLISYGLAGGEVILNAVKNILKGKVFDENFLMTIATIGAILISEYPEAVAVMLLYQIGELFQDYAVIKSRKSISSLIQIMPDYVNIKRGDRLIKVRPEDANMGDIIVIKAGEKIPLDSRILQGSSTVDTSVLTGEALPRYVEEGSEILSGCINLNGVITAQVTKPYEESTVSKILNLVENANNKKSQSERFITKFARYYTPFVVIVAVLLAFVPPFVYAGADFNDWMYRALAFLVISCPCALVISIPLSFFSGIGTASRKGILIKGGNYLEALAKTETIVFDKTGTLTKGVFKIREIHAEKISDKQLVELAAYAENYSNHPISNALKEAYGLEINNERISDVKEIPGKGVIASVDGKKVIVGNDKLMEKTGITYYKGEFTGTVVHVAVNNVYAGYMLIDDEIKDDSLNIINDLNRINIRQAVMLTGDNKKAANSVAEKLGIKNIYSELLPADKVDILEGLMSKISERGKLIFVGDGINDAPVLARADIGIAMGGLGSDAAIEAADIVIMTDEPSKIINAINISKKTLKIAQMNTVLAIFIKALVLMLSALGLTTMWAAIFADVGVTILAVLNTWRITIN